MKEKKALIIIPENEWFPATASNKQKKGPLEHNQREQKNSS